MLPPSSDATPWGRVRARSRCSAGLGQRGPLCQQPVEPPTPGRQGLLGSETAVSPPHPYLQGRTTRLPRAVSAGDSDTAAGRGVVAGDYEAAGVLGVKRLISGERGEPAVCMITRAARSSQDLRRRSGPLGKPRGRARLGAEPTVPRLQVPCSPTTERGRLTPHAS